MFIQDVLLRKCRGIRFVYYNNLMIQQFKKPILKHEQISPSSPGRRSPSPQARSPGSPRIESSRPLFRKSGHNNQKQYVIPELVELEREIVGKRPNNIMMFIRDWASSRVNKLTRTYQDGEYFQESDEEQFEFHLKKASNLTRRYALRVNNTQFDQPMPQVRQIPKLEQTKSIILIKLKSMQLLRNLTNEILWKLVEDFTEKQYKNQQIIIQRSQPIKLFYIVVAGTVTAASTTKKQAVVNQGNCFGQESLLFGMPAKWQYSSSGVSRVAQIEGRKITRLIREYNKQRYGIIWHALQKIEYLKLLHDDEVDRIAEIALNSEIIITEPSQQIIMDVHSSFFIVMQGLFYSYIRKLSEQPKKQPSEQFKSGDAFGYQSLKRDRSTNAIISQQHGRIIQIKCSDIERVLGPLAKVQKRKKKRK